MIFSAQSPLPRSISANLTFDLFGHSINLLEVGGRLEGVEYLLETVLGPYSFFSTNTNDAKVRPIPCVRQYAFVTQGKLEDLKGPLY